MSIIAEFFIDIIFKRFLVRFLGVRMRLLLYKLVGKEVSINELTGEDGNIESQVSQDFFNAAIGFVTLLAIVTLIAYLFYG